MDGCHLCSSAPGTATGGEEARPREKGERGGLRDHRAIEQNAIEPRAGAGGVRGRRGFRHVDAEGNGGHAGKDRVGEVDRPGFRGIGGMGEIRADVHKARTEVVLHRVNRAGGLGGVQSGEECQGLQLEELAACGADGKSDIVRSGGTTSRSVRVIDVGKGDGETAGTRLRTGGGADESRVAGSSARVQAQ